MKRIIWQNLDVDADDYKDFLEEYYPEVTDEDEKQRLVWELNETYLEDEIMNLDIQLENPIIVIADLGLWYGRRSGYRVIDSGNINEIFSEFNCEYQKWYADAYNVRFTGYHHDGANHYVYRMIKNVDKLDLVLNKIYNGTLTKQDMSRYTKSIRPEVAAVYGW